MTREHTTRASQKTPATNGAPQPRIMTRMAIGDILYKYGANIYDKLFVNDHYNPSNFVLRKSNT